MIDVGPEQTSETGPRSRSNPNERRAPAIRAVSCCPTGIGAQGTVLMPRQTWPPSWSVAAIRRWRETPRTDAIRALIDEADVAFWLRLTTSRPPNCRCLQSVRTDAAAAPLTPT